MDTVQVTEVLREMVWVVIKLGGPILLLCMAIGILMAIFQAVTQIHEQSLAFVLKLVVVVLVLTLGGSWMMETLLDFSRSLFVLMQG